jgi:hypothetical protein
VNHYYYFLLLEPIKYILLPNCFTFFLVTLLLVALFSFKFTLGFLNLGEVLLTVLPTFEGLVAFLAGLLKIMIF